MADACGRPLLRSRGAHHAGSIGRPRAGVSGRLRQTITAAAHALDRSQAARACAWSEAPRIGGTDACIGSPPIETLKAWQCIGCGRLEAPQNCIGVCRDRKVELVYASELAEAEGKLDAARGEVAELRAFLLKLAGTRPRDGQWERSWRWLQDEAAALLARHGGETAAPKAAAASSTSVEMPAETRAREA